MAEREKLPYIELLGFQGLFTKPSSEVLEAQQLRQAQNCDFFKEYGSVAKLSGSRRVLSSIYTESGNAKPISWIGFHKTPDLDGTILRHILAATGTRLSRVESDGTLTTLATGRRSGRFHTNARLGRFTFISNQNPDRVGDGDDMVKYDGCVMSKWGIIAPGSQERVRDNFDDASSWTGINTIPENETDVTWDGASLELPKIVTTDRIFSIEKAMDFYVQINHLGEQDTRSSELSPPNRMSFYTFIPCGKLTASDLDTSGFFATSGEAIAVWVSPDATTFTPNNWKFYFSIGELVEGWNKLNLDFSTQPTGGSNGQFYPEVDLIRRVKFEYRLKSNSTILASPGVKIDRFVNYDQGTPVATPSGSGSLTGAYQYKIVFVSKYGALSNAGPASTSVTASSNSQIALTRLPISSDPQVIKRRIYRTVANGTVFLFVDEVQDNVTTTYTDTVLDVSLGNETPPQAGDFNDDNSPPPKGGIVATWKRTVFIAGDPQNPESLYYSEDDDPESFPIINEFVLDGKITAIYETYSALIVETETGKYQVLGDNPDFSLSKIIEGVGCVGRRAAGTARVTGYSVDRDGLRLYDGNTHAKISEAIRDKYDDDINKVNIEFIHTVHSKRKNTILQFNPDDTSIDLTTTYPTYDAVFAWQYASSQDDVSKGQWADIIPPSGLNFLDAEEIEDSNGDFKVYAGGADGMIYELLAENQKNWVDANGSAAAIDTIFATPFLRLGETGVETEGASGRVEPRFVELRAVGDASTWDVTLEMADGPEDVSVKDSVTLNIEFDSSDSLVRQPVTMNIHPANYMRIKIRNNQVNVASRILACRVYYHVRPFEGQRNV